MGSIEDQIKLFGSAGVASALAFIILFIAATLCATDWSFGVNKISDLATDPGSAGIYMAALAVSGILAAVMGAGVILANKEPFGRIAGLLVLLAGLVLTVLAFVPSGDTHVTVASVFAGLAMGAILVSAIADVMDKMYVNAILSAAFAIAAVALFFTMSDRVVFAVVIALWILIQGAFCFAPELNDVKSKTKVAFKKDADVQKAKADKAAADKAKADEAKAKAEKAKVEKAKAEKEKAEKAKAEKAAAEKAKAEKAAAEKAKADEEKAKAEKAKAAAVAVATEKAKADQERASKPEHENSEEKPAKRAKIAFREEPTPADAIRREKPVVEPAPAAVVEPVAPVQEAAPAEAHQGEAIVEEPAVEEPVVEPVAPVQEAAPAEAHQGEAIVEEPAVEKPVVEETVIEEPEVEEIGEDTYTDNSPEALVRRAAWNKGLRCRRDYGEHAIPVAFVKGKVAVFVQPADADTSIDDVLRSEGWTVLRYDEATITDGKDQGDEIRLTVKENLRQTRATSKKNKK